MVKHVVYTSVLIVFLSTGWLPWHRRHSRYTRQLWMKSAP